MVDYTNSPNFKEVTYISERLGADTEIIESCLTDLDLNITKEEYIKDVLKAQLVGFIYSNTIDERQLEYYCERPSFLDWLFRRKKKVMFNFKAKDLLINPPKDFQNKALRVYEIYKK